MPKRLKVLWVLLLVVLFGLSALVSWGITMDNKPHNKVPDKAAETEETTGSIKVESDPSGADIYVDGEDVEMKTPHTLYDLTPDTYTIKLTIAGYKDWEDDIEVEAGEETLVTATLTKEEVAPLPKPPDVTAPLTPRQLCPASGSHYEGPIPGYQVTLSWSTVSDPSGVAYGVEIQYYMAANTWSAGETRTNLTYPRYTMRFNWANQRWRVWAVDGAGNQSAKSGWWYVDCTSTCPPRDDDV